MSEIDRLYRYKTLLSSRRALPRDVILKELEISPATFKRDIAKLRDRLHTPIVFDRDLSGYRLEQTDSTELPGMWFSQDEMLALMTIQSMIVQLEPGLLGPKLKPLQKRLDDMLTSQGLDAATLTQRVRRLGFFGRFVRERKEANHVGLYARANCLPDEFYELGCFSCPGRSVNLSNTVFSGLPVVCPRRCALNSQGIASKGVALVSSFLIPRDRFL